ncbi:hypothetical protein [Bacillus sp. FJAT-50079]|nr:hypothetical protein [Bacillus sp. FJAT-50079]
MGKWLEKCVKWLVNKEKRLEKCAKWLVNGKAARKMCEVARK